MLVYKYLCNDPEYAYIRVFYSVNVPTYMVFSRFVRIPACDGQTDGRTNIHLATA